MSAAVLCVGGLADGRRELIDEAHLRQGHRFVARQDLPYPLDHRMDLKDLAARMRTEAYEVRRLNCPSGPPGGREEVIFLASPEGWSLHRTMCRLVIGYPDASGGAL